MELQGEKGICEQNTETKQPGKASACVTFQIFFYNIYLLQKWVVEE